MTRLERNQPSARGFLGLSDAELLGQCDVDCYRSRGPGGQKRNKTSSAVRLRHGPTGLAVIAAEDRSQHVNRVRAIRRLRHAIALHVRRDLDAGRYVPSELLAGCTVSGEVNLGRRDGRYPMAVCEILDLLHACGMSVRDTAARLSVPTAQLVKFLQNDPKLWQRVNELRAGAGLKPLR